MRIQARLRRAVAAMTILAIWAVKPYVSSIIYHPCKNDNTIRKRCLSRIVLQGLLMPSGLLSTLLDWFHILEYPDDILDLRLG